MKSHVRSKAVFEAYKKHREKFGNEYGREFHFDLSKENIIHEETYWVIIPNDFPYDLVFKTHHLLVPKRYFSHAGEMKKEEFDELQTIKKKYDPDYHCLIENFSDKRSVNGHFHIHLCEWK